MVAVADVIKKMQADGMTREQIIDSLAELGFPNAEELYDKNAGGAGAKPPTLQAPAPKPFGLAEAAKKENEETEQKEETEAREEAGENPLFAQAAKKEKETEEESAVESDEKENPPSLNITQVGDDGLEKTVSIEDMLSRGAQTNSAGAIGAAGASGAGASAAARFETASLRAKLDETNALLKALSDVNKKILETDREVLMRLKAKETKPA